MAKTKSKPKSKPTRTRSAAAAAGAGASVDDRLAVLREVARLSQIMIDAELISQLLSPHGQLWTSPDDIDYNYQPFIALKRTVLRLELTPTNNRRVFINVWRRRPDNPDNAEPLLAGMKLTLFGRGTIPMPRSLRAAMLNGRVSHEAHASGAISVFAPLYDSLHHVAGAVEVFDDPLRLNYTA